MDETTGCKTNGIGNLSTAHLNLKRTMKAQWDREFELHLSVLKPSERAGQRARAAIISGQQAHSLWIDAEDRNY